MKTTNNQENINYTSHKGIQLRLHVKVKILYIYSIVEYLNLFWKVRLFVTPA